MFKYMFALMLLVLGNTVSAAEQPHFQQLPAIIDCELIGVTFSCMKGVPDQVALVHDDGKQHLISTKAELFCENGVCTDTSAGYKALGGSYEHPPEGMDSFYAILPVRFWLYSPVPGKAYAVNSHAIPEVAQQGLMDWIIKHNLHRK